MSSFSIVRGDSLDSYAQWPTPTAIVSDGGYGVLGFDGDTVDHHGLPEWYEPHIRAWSAFSTPQTTLWFWNSEVGWAAVHPVLERHGWRYVNANVWNKGKAHIAGNVNTGSIRRFPVVTEICVQYVREARIAGKPLKAWLLAEWKRSGLPLREANTACGGRRCRYAQVPQPEPRVVLPAARHVPAAAGIRQHAGACFGTALLSRSMARRR